MHNFTLKITSARARIRARLNKGPVVSLVEKIRARATKRANTVFLKNLCFALLIAVKFYSSEFILYRCFGRQFRRFVIKDDS